MYVRMYAPFPVWHGSSMLPRCTRYEGHTHYGAQDYIEKKKDVSDGVGICVYTIIDNRYNVHVPPSDSLGILLLVLCIADRRKIISIHAISDMLQCC